MATPVTTPTPSQQATTARSYAGPMGLMTLLFLLFGAVTNFNDVLMPYRKDGCQLTNLQSSAGQSAFFGTYFLIFLPASKVLEKLNCQRDIVTGLLVMAGGPPIRGRFW